MLQYEDRNPIGKERNQRVRRVDCVGVSYLVCRDIVSISSLIMAIYELFL